ncbi:MAG: HD domain-containing protein [Candidatus Micrarchaeota archaeon]
MSKASPSFFKKKLVLLLKKKHPKARIEKVSKALAFGIKAHGNQKRASDEPYWIHPANVAFILAEMGADPDCVAAALLHDVIEDTNVTESDLKKEFGPTITDLVLGVTKLDIVSRKGHESFKHAKNIQRMMLAASYDLRVMVIKLADKLHNLRTLQHLPKEKRIRIAAETLQVYVPLAHKLGMHDVMHELEDLAFRFVDPKKFSKLRQKIEEHRKPVIRSIEQVIRRLRSKSKIKADFFVYKKSIFSVYSKLKRTGKPISELYDCAVLNVEVNTNRECYDMLGDIHLAYPPVPNKFKDYIAMPNMNLYRALHTTVLGENGRPIKVYIATRKMCEVNRKGFVAITDSEKKSYGGFNKQLKKLNKLFKLPEFVSETDEFMELLTLDVLPINVFVFTPKGDIIELQYGSTPIDFAFKINPILGRHTWRAKVNGHFVPLHHLLSSGDIVEIVPSKIVQANHQWLSLAKTIATKKHIEAVLSKKRFQKQRSVDVKVWISDRIGSLLQTTSAFSKEKINLAAFLSNPSNHRTGLLQFNIPAYSNQKIQKLVDRLNQIDGVQKIEIQKN